jgi:ABC-type molybdate transport system permease subunit
VADSRIAWIWFDRHQVLKTCYDATKGYPLLAFWRVTLPLALPTIVVAALVAFLLGYAEFAIGWLFVEAGEIDLKLLVASQQAL